jgi:hypothetical protein
MNDSGKISSYKGYIDSKKIYLKRKKQLNREIRYFTKKKRMCKKFGRRYFGKIVEKRMDDLYLLRIMYNYYKYENKQKKLKI